MAINLKDILKIIVKPKSNTARILIEYGKLEQQLKEPEHQSEYFQYGIQNHKKKLIELKDDFEDIRNDFNDTSLDVLISKLSEIKIEKETLIKQSLNTMKLIYLSSLESNINYLDDLVELKSRISKKMMPIDYYIRNTDDFLIITGWCNPELDSRNVIGAKR